MEPMSSEQKEKEPMENGEEAVLENGQEKIDQENGHAPPNEQENGSEGMETDNFEDNDHTYHHSNPFTSPIHSPSFPQLCSPPPPTTAPHADYIDSDYELAKALQAEEDRRADLIRRSYQPGRIFGPNNAPQGYPSIDEEDDDEDEQSYSGSDMEEVKDCWRLYRQCQEECPKMKLPAPMSVPHVTPTTFMNAYYDVLNGLPFPRLDRDVPESPPVPPGSPGLSEPGPSEPGPSEPGPSRKTTTTAYRVIRKSPTNGDKQWSKLLIKIPEKDMPCISKPSAFDNFVSAANGQIKRVSAVPLFSRDRSPEDEDRYSPGFTAEMVRRIQEDERRKNAIRKRQRLDELEEEEEEYDDSQPGPSNRIPSYRSSNKTLNRNGGGPTYPEFDEDGREKPKFAVPALPKKIGRKLLVDCSENVEISPAAKRFRVTPVYPHKQATHSECVTEHTNNNDIPSTSAGPPQRQSRRCKYFSDELRRRHPFLRRTDDADSLFNMDHVDEYDEDEDPEISCTTTKESEVINWPCIAWKDPEDMGSLDDIDDKEVRKMPAEYSELIVLAHLDRQAKEAEPKPPPSRFDKFQIIADKEEAEERERFEGEYLEICRSTIPSPNIVPVEVFNTKFEVYIRFPFFERPLYVQNVLTILGIADNKGNIMLDMPLHIKKMTVGEFFKRGVNIWMGLSMDDLPVNVAISEVEQEDAIERYLGGIATRLMDEASLQTDIEERKCAESLIDSFVDSIRRQDVNGQDVFEMHLYSVRLMEKQKQSALRRRMKAIGKTLAQTLPACEYTPTPIAREEIAETEENDENDPSRAPPPLSIEIDEDEFEEEIEDEQEEEEEEEGMLEIEEDFDVEEVDPESANASPRNIPLERSEEFQEEEEEVLVEDGEVNMEDSTLILEPEQEAETETQSAPQNVEDEWANERKSGVLQPKNN